ncbi:3'-phosphoadenosine 5'-phosphosulfate sulfotransferase [Geopyxis carbonaria]|nr:3'-phosphoadenosine 5'-phosphosulfate sulfotransferase [Geopyxis carbonaria]
MFSRLSQISKHLSKPIMTSSITDPFKRPIRTAACLIIGDEVLNGKTVDTNSAYFAKYCFSLGIDLKRIEVIADDESEIIEAARRMSANYDFIVTSGGIGPTHDDITYPSLAKAFSSPLALHDETATRMRRLAKRRPGQIADFDWDTPSVALTARLRMAQLPTGPSCRVLYVADDMWVPIAVVNHNVHILPGVPSIFTQLLDGLRPLLEKDGRLDSGRKSVRVLISTPLPESEVAGFLTALQEKVTERGVKVGSYPRWGKGRNTITLVGSDGEFIESLVKEVEEGCQGTRVENEADCDEEEEKEADRKAEEVVEKTGEMKIT